MRPFRDVSERLLSPSLRCGTAPYPPCPAYERAARQQRLRTELAQSKRENSFYLQNVEKARVLDIVAERKRKRADDEADGGADSGAGAGSGIKRVAKPKAVAEAAAAAAARFEQAKAKFRQREPILTDGSDALPGVASKVRFPTLAHPSRELKLTPPVHAWVWGVWVSRSCLRGSWRLPSFLSGFVHTVFICHMGRSAGVNPWMCGGTAHARNH